MDHVPSAELEKAIPMTLEARAQLADVRLKATVTQSRSKLGLGTPTAGGSSGARFATQLCMDRSLLHGTHHLIFSLSRTPLMSTISFELVRLLSTSSCFFQAEGLQQSWRVSACSRAQVSFKLLTLACRIAQETKHTRIRLLRDIYCSPRGYVV